MNKPETNAPTNSSTLLAERLRGILLPPTTPFLKDGQVDHASLAANLESWTRKGVSGFVLLGSTGERVHLNEREYLDVIAASRSVVPESFGFLVGAGQQSTRGTVAEVRGAADAGAEAVLVLTPAFYRSAITQPALVDFYTCVADASPIPVVLYSMPALTGIKIEPETIAQLAEHPNIIGVKDSSNDVDGFGRTVEQCPPGFAVLTGNGTVLLDALKRGATGGILAVGCAVPEVCLEVFRLFKAGEVERAEILQSKLTPLAAAVTTRFGIGGLKAALNLAGYIGGTVRAPLQSPTEAQCAEILQLLNEVQINIAAR